MAGLRVDLSRWPGFPPPLPKHPDTKDPNTYLYMSQRILKGSCRLWSCSRIFPVGPSKQRQNASRPSGAVASEKTTQERMRSCHCFWSPAYTVSRLGRYTVSSCALIFTRSDEVAHGDTLRDKHAIVIASWLLNPANFEFSLEIDGL